MVGTAPQSLRSSHSSPDEEDALSGNAHDIDLSARGPLAAYYRKHPELQDIPIKIIKRAWFTTAHLLLEPGSTLIDVGCGSGMKSYAMAALTPNINFIAIDMDKRKVAKAARDYVLPNLEFRAGDVTNDLGLEENSVDAILNSFTLHEIFSSARYDDRPVIAALGNQFKLLKDDGIIMIHDYSQPPPGEYVLLEMPDSTSAGDKLQQLSEPDLLLWYSEHARPREDRGCHGFFLEELPPRFPKTRLFRLPYKWAYEFMVRKDQRRDIESELHKEYAFFTPREYRKNLRALGARVLYTAPQWEDSVIRNKFDGRFRLYDDTGKPLGAPPTSFIAIAQKTRRDQSLRLTERRPSRQEASHIQIAAVRNEDTGEVSEIVSRNISLSDILPYRITDDGTLNVFVHFALPRALVNAVPRHGRNIDERGWSGHMTEAMAVDSEIIDKVDKDSLKETVLFARDYIGLKPSMGHMLEKGPTYFPAPDYIDEKIDTWFLRVERHENGVITPRHLRDELEGFTFQGTIREFSAQALLNAIQVGFIPNARLEIQITALCKKLGIETENWEECPLRLNDIEIKDKLSPAELKKRRQNTDHHFKSIKGRTGQLRSINSVFVDEGLTRQGIGGLQSKNMEFVISEEGSQNIAAVLPLAKDIVSQEVMAGLVSEYLPIPERKGHMGATIRVPTLPLPPEVTNMEAARQYIAEKFSLPVDNVAKFGESYFCHLGVTPQRIFPFVITPKTGKMKNPFGGPIEFYPVSRMIFEGQAVDFVDDYHAGLYLLEKFKKTHRYFERGTVMADWSLSQKFETPDPGVKTLSGFTPAYSAAPVKSETAPAALAASSEATATPVIEQWAPPENVSDEQDNSDHRKHDPALHRKLDPH